MIKKITFYAFCILIFSTCQNSSNDYEKKIIGDWKYSVYLDNDEVKELFGGEDEMPQGVTAEMTMKGTDEYLIGNRYNTDSKMVMRFDAAGNEMKLSFNFLGSGSWKIIDKEIVTILEGSDITPLDDFTRQMIKQSPELLESMTPPIGMSESAEIIELTEESLRLKPKSFKGIIVNHTRK